MIQSTESGIESNSTLPVKEIDSLADRPLSKSNPIIGGSWESALADGDIIRIAAVKTIAVAMIL